jgi:hypothetical protein
MPTQDEKTTLDALRAERQRLALDAAEGDAEAVVALEAVEREIARLVRDDERANLAGLEREARATAAERRASERLHDEVLLADAVLAQTMASIITRIESRTADVMADITEGVRLGRERYANLARLGRYDRKLLVRQPIANYLLAQLGTLLAPHIERPITKWWHQPLSKLVGTKEPKESE